MKDLLSVIDYYINNDNLWSYEFDWFFVNSLLSAELIASQKALFPQLMPLSKFNWAINTSKEFSMKYFLWASLRTVIKLALFIVLASMFYSFSPYIMFLYLIFI